uniref:Diacylglycerol kinase type I N-terminal domain-containing protein n=1 Tax=Vespula pensylvanica TaxID=30213 RepID=A0A834UFP1_VESPE|nr:hypothetical protein H0235_004053 [Vespula pensylvanica]
MEAEENDDEFERIDDVGSPLLDILRYDDMDSIHTEPGQLLFSINPRDFSLNERKKDIDYEGFRKFLDTYLEVATPDELSRHLFLSFVRKDSRGVDGKAFKEMAVLSSTTACAAITSHTTSSSNVNSTGLPGGGACTDSHVGSSSLVDKIHGLTEKLQALGHHRTESEASSRTRTGSVHPMLTVTRTSYSCHDVLEKKSTDSSPSHSQMSRNSSRKSNNSLLVNNGKLEANGSPTLVLDWSPPISIYT